jgi:hypothetical protein
MHIRNGNIQKAQPTHIQKPEKKTEHGFIEWLDSKTTSQTIDENKNPRVTALERLVAKLLCTNFTLAPTGSHINIQDKLP